MSGLEALDITSQTLGTELYIEVLLEQNNTYYLIIILYNLISNKVRNKYM